MNCTICSSEEVTREFVVWDMTRVTVFQVANEVDRFALCYAHTEALYYAIQDITKTEDDS